MKYKNEIQKSLTKISHESNTGDHELQVQIQEINHKFDQLQPMLKATYEKNIHMEDMVNKYELKMESIKKDIL